MKCYVLDFQIFGFSVGGVDKVRSGSGNSRILETSARFTICTERILTASGLTGMSLSPVGTLAILSRV